jgi:hypothetical protein
MKHATQYDNTSHSSRHSSSSTSIDMLTCSHAHHQPPTTNHQLIIRTIHVQAKGATGVEAGGDQLDNGALGVVDGITTISAAVKNDAFIKSIEQAIVDTNKNSVCCPMNAAKIQKFTILPRDFCVESGDLTPTLKLKRSVVVAKHTEMIDKLYNNKSTYMAYE